MSTILNAVWAYMPVRRISVRCIPDSRIQLDASHLDYHILN